VLRKDFDVVASVHNGREAIEEVQRLDPDVLVIDISMRVLNGLQAASQLRSTTCRTKIVFLTALQGEDFIAAAFSVGASAYVINARLNTELMLAIHKVLQGQTYVSSVKED
jgi:two-component system response regulator NreC